jgi:predicted signal transduction protein with EAL and GGDEF domain
MGVRISMDDFGTGYSSLARLRHLPVSELKIDRSFVAELDQDATLTRVVLSLAGSLGLLTVAEGVETADQLATLRRLGADAAQGYHLARPMSETDFVSWPTAPGDPHSPDVGAHCSGRARHRAAGAPRRLADSLGEALGHDDALTESVATRSPQ